MDDIVYTHIYSLVVKLEQSSTCDQVWWLIQKDYHEHKFEKSKLKNIPVFIDGNLDMMAYFC